MTEFKWETVSDFIVQNEVPTVAIYDNPNGDVVIRRSALTYEGEDVWILIARANAPAAAQAILDAAGIDATITINRRPSVKAREPARLPLLEKADAGG